MPKLDGSKPSKAEPPQAVRSGTERRLRQLPRDIADFTGRDGVFDEICRYLTADVETRSTPAISLISGKGGVGKTALATRVSHHIKNDFPDGQIFVNLRGVEPAPGRPQIILSELLRQLGADRIPSDEDSLAAMFRSILSGRKFLLVLDNAASAAQIRPLLPAEPRCAVVITSRPPLSGVEGSKITPLGILDRESSVSLLSGIVGADRVDQERAAAAEVSELCGRLPLALRIAGAKLLSKPHWQVADLGNRLRDQRQRLNELEVGDREVRSSLMLSYSGRTEDERQAFCLLALIGAPDFPSWILAALLDCDGRTAERLIERLVDAQLLEARHRDLASQARYGFHDLLRDVARERLADEVSIEFRASAIDRLASGYLALLGERQLPALPFKKSDQRLRKASRWYEEETPRRLATAAGATTWLGAERTCVVAAVQTSYEYRLFTEVIQLTQAIAEFLEENSYWNDLETTHSIALRACREVQDREGEAVILRGLGIALRDRGQFDDARVSLMQALGIFRDYDDHLGEARARSDLAILDQYRGSFADAIDNFDRAFRLFEQSQDRSRSAWSLRSLGQLYRDLRRYDEADSTLNRSLTIFEAIRDDRGTGWALRSLGEVHRMQNRFEESAACFRRSLSVLQKCGDRRGTGYLLRSIGDLERTQGQFAPAAEHLSMSAAIFDDLGDQRGRAWSRWSSGELCRVTGSLTEAISLFEEALSIFHQSGAREWEAIALRSLGEVYRDARDPRRSSDYFQRALHAFEEVGDTARATRVRTTMVRASDDEAQASAERDSRYSAEEAGIGLNRTSPDSQTVDADSSVSEFRAIDISGTTSQRGPSVEHISISERNAGIDSIPFDVASSIGTRHKVDVLLVVATEVEREALLAAFEEASHAASGRVFVGVNSYWLFPPIKDARIALVQCREGSGGPGGSTLTVAEAIATLDPDAVIMPGIAFGVNPRKQHIGDILLAKQILNYELRRMGTDASGELVERIRGSRPDASPRLLDRFIAARLGRMGLNVHEGLVLSGEKLVDNVDYREKLHSFAAEAIGGEMEGAGTYAAAQRANRDWILVKAICDFADGNKRRNKAARQRRAATAAAAAVLHVLQEGGFVSR